MRIGRDGYRNSYGDNRDHYHYLGKSKTAPIIEAQNVLSALYGYDNDMKLSHYANIVNRSIIKRADPFRIRPFLFEI